METSAAALRKGTSDFMGWWLGELSELVPTPLRHALKPAERTIAVTIDENRISLTKIEGGNTEPLGNFATQSNEFGTSPRELDQLLTKFPTGRWRWGLYLKGDAVLRAGPCSPRVAAVTEFPVGSPAGSPISGLPARASGL